MILILLVMVVLVLRPKFLRVSVFTVAVLMIYLGVALMYDSSHVWSEGVGIFRGTRRGFSSLPYFADLGTWDSFGLFLCTGLFILIGTARKVSTVGKPTAVALLAFVGIVFFNDVRLVAASWSLMAAVAVWTSVEDSSIHRGSWVAAAMTTVCVGVLFSTGMIQGEFSHYLIGSSGGGGILDMDGLARIRHAYLVLPFGGKQHLSMCLPIALSLASLSAVLMFPCSRPMLTSIGAAAGPALMMKLFPLAELGIKDGSGFGIVSAVLGLLLLVLIGFRHPSVSRRMAVVCTGGALALLGAKMPGRAAIWVLLFAPMSWSEDRIGVLPLVVTAFGAVFLLSPLHSWISYFGPWVLAIGIAAAFGVGVSLPKMNRDIRWLSMELIRATFVVLFLIPPISALFWPAWTGKFRMELPISATPWLTSGLALVAGIAVSSWGFALVLGRTMVHLERAEEKLRDFSISWIAPLFDTVAVVWVALERFGLQGFTLWLPRRFVQWGGIHISWLETVTLRHIRFVPEQIVELGARTVERLFSSPRNVVLFLGVFLVVGWIVFGGIR